MGKAGLGFDAACGANVTSLPPRFWIALHFNLSFWPFSLNMMPGPGLTLSLMLVVRTASASAFGSVVPARLNASAATSSASNVYTWLVFRFRPGWDFLIAASSFFVHGLFCG